MFRLVLLYIFTSLQIGEVYFLYIAWWQTYCLHTVFIGKIVSESHNVRPKHVMLYTRCCSMMSYVVFCCSMLSYVVGCCSTLQNLNMVRISNLNVPVTSPGKRVPISNLSKEEIFEIKNREMCPLTYVHISFFLLKNNPIFGPAKNHIFES